MLKLLNKMILFKLLFCLFILLGLKLTAYNINSALGVQAATVFSFEVSSNELQMTTFNNEYKLSFENIGYNLSYYKQKFIFLMSSVFECIQNILEKF